MHTITEIASGWMISSHKPSVGWETIDRICLTLDDAKAFCATNGLDFKIKTWADMAKPEPDFGQDYRSYAEKENAYDYWEA